MSQATKPVKTAPKAPKPAAKKQSPAAMPEAKHAAAKKAVAKKVVAKKAAAKRELGKQTLIQTVQAKRVKKIIKFADGEKAKIAAEQALPESIKRRVIIFEGREIDIDAVKASLSRRIANSAARANEKTMGVFVSTTPAAKKLNAETIQNLVKNAASGQSRQNTKPTR